MNTKKIVLAGGCFWGVEKFFSLLKGVTHTETAYVNGNTENPTYQQVCHENTNHAEAILIEYDHDQISLSELLEYFYQIIDPVALNKQGNDIGTQYRTGIYYTNLDDMHTAQESLATLQKSIPQKIAIELKPLMNYSTAEEYHQNYLDKNPAGYCHISQSKFDIARATNK